MVDIERTDQGGTLPSLFHLSGHSNKSRAPMTYYYAPKGGIMSVECLCGLFYFCYSYFVRQDQLINKFKKTTTTVFIYLAVMGVVILDSSRLSARQRFFTNYVYVRWRHQSLQHDSAFLKIFL